MTSMTAPIHPTRAQGSPRPIRNLDDLARHVSRQFPEFKRRQVLAVLHAACYAIGHSLEAQGAAAMATVPEEATPHVIPRVTLRGFGAFELRWHRASRWPKLRGGLQDIPARWKPRFVFNPRWRARFKVAGATVRSA